MLVGLSVVGKKSGQRLGGHKLAVASPGFGSDTSAAREERRKLPDIKRRHVESQTGGNGLMSGSCHVTLSPCRRCHRLVGRKHDFGISQEYLHFSGLSLCVYNTASLISKACVMDLQAGYCCLTTTEPLAWCVARTSTSAIWTCGGAEAAYSATSAMSSPVSGLMPLYTFAARSLSP